MLLAGLIEQNGAELIKDKVSVLGPNDGRVKLLAPDGFAQQATIDDTGPAAAGMYASVPGRVPDSLTGPGKTLVDQLTEQAGGEPVELFAPYAGQAAEVMLDSVAKGGTARGKVIMALFSTQVSDGITGSFRILPSGDPSLGPITVSVARDAFEPSGVILPRPGLVAAARRG